MRFTASPKPTLAALTLGAAALLCVATAVRAEGTAPPARPNILLIVADDLGYSDLGAYGGEIDTPHLDAIARDGVRLTSFYSAPFCSPTRAMLMSGTDNHLAGFGGMAELLTPDQKGRPGYEGFLNDRVVPFPQLLRDSGYHTYMAGKWHLGVMPEVSPARRGFEQSYAMVQGGAGHFDQTGIITGDPAKPPRAIYNENGQLVDVPTRGFYSSEFFARRMISYIDRGRGDGKPFFGYLAFTAPHWPLQAYDETIRKYEGRYDVGYDAIRDKRTTRQKALGIIPKEAQVYTGHPLWPKWSTLTAAQKQTESKRMAVYAAMVDDMDYYIGEVVNYLKKTGQYDNTLILFMSDNGADGNTALDEGRTREWVKTRMDNSLANSGRKGSYIDYGPNWAQVGSNPFHLYKGFLYEGGISVPFIASWPALGRKGQISDSFAHTMDIAPTLLELAGARHPGTEYQGRAVLPLRGRSMLAMLTGQRDSVHPADHVHGWELGGRKALRKGDWKIVYSNRQWGTGDWELYDLSKDRSELNNLAASQPAKLSELVAEYERYVREVGVVDIPGLAERKGYSNGTRYFEDMQ